jgi:hypothetical protein
MATKRPTEVYRFRNHTVVAWGCVMKFVRSETIDINASRERVFALVTALADEPTLADKVQLVSSAAPHRCVHECSDGHSAYRWTFDLTTSPTGTTVHQTVEALDTNGFTRMLQPFRWELSQCGQIRGVLGHLKAAAEAPAIPQPRQDPSRQAHSVS